MSVEQKRILIFGAGVIGRIYALKFIEAWIDVTVFARSNTFDTLKEKGIQYSDKGAVKSVPVKVIDKLENDDVYDFVLVTVRYDQAEAALLALKDNQSKNIVTMTNSTIGFSSWLGIVGDRLLPAFPGAGGQIIDGILYGRIPPKFMHSGMLGEMDGTESERLKTLTELFETAKLPYTIIADMNAYLITHSVSDIAMLSFLQPENKLSDGTFDRSRKTAHQTSVIFKTYLSAIKEAGIPITPSSFEIVLKCPYWIMDSLFMFFLGSKMAKNMMLPDYAASANRETEQLKRDLLTFLNRNDS